MPSNLVIVESPAKAKTINKYLGKDYKVIASYGHVRDLPPKDGSVRPEEDFAMSWQPGDRSDKQIKEIVKLARDADTIYLATDPDREGEAISWHVTEILKEKKVLNDGAAVRRVTFNEITEKAVKEAFEHARDLDSNLIDAYLARRALDYLVGFNLSPILWRKLPGSRSAGRVQSVALRLIVEREREIEVFRPEEYWSIEAGLQNPDGKDFTARLSRLDGEKLDKMSIGSEGEAKKAVSRIEGQNFTVQTVEKKQVKRNPAPPFITSTLQQEASRKLNFGATQTMRTAQKLYEGVDIGGETVGLITYMRTDGITLSGQAIAQARHVIEERFGADYLPKSPRAYKSKAKNAQEAHEAIRPTNLSRTPDSVRKYLDADQAALYDLIWKRTLACQMESAVLDQVGVDIANGAGDVVLRATGSVIAFDGFIKVYREDYDDVEEDEDDKILPPLNEGDAITVQSVTPNQHFTQPPPRYTEASLVKKLEELGIGRPSTYASILQVLQDRGYVHMDKKRFVPEDRGRVVTSFLYHFFQEYVEYDFTASLEEQLDEISAGDVSWKQVLSDFWSEFKSAIDGAKDLTITEVIDRLDADLEPHLFPPDPEGKTDPRKCPQCEDGRLGLKLGKFGGFIGCSNYPDCRFTRQLMVPHEGDDPTLAQGVIELGSEPETGLPVSLRRGPYGPYVQLGPAEDADPKEKPKRTSIPKTMIISEIDLDVALALLSLPRVLGQHPDTGKDVTAGIGRFGPYVKHDNTFKSIPKDENVLTIGMNRAVDLLAQAKKSGRGGGAGKLKDLGAHPEDGKPVSVHTGRYGPYIKWNKVNATLPKDTEPDTVTLDDAVALLAKKAEKAGAKKSPAKKKAGGAKKPAAKKKTSKTKKPSGDS